MVQLPTREDLGGLPSARSGRPIARLDTSNVGRGQMAQARAVQDVARGVTAIGQAATELEAKRQAHEAAVSKYVTERKFQEFMWEKEKALDESMRNMEPGQAEGFAQSWSESYAKDAKEFFGAVPEKFKKEYDTRLFAGERKMYGAANTFAKNEQKRFSIQSIGEAKQNIYLSKAGETATADLDSLADDYAGLVGRNPYLTPIEKDKVLRDGGRDIALAHLDALDPDEVEKVLSSEDQPKIFQVLTHKDRVEAIEAAERERKSLERAEDRIESDTRSEIAKTGYDMLAEDKMDAAWLKQNRDILLKSDYKTFLKALEPGYKSRKTEPEEYLRLFDLVQDDPEAALDELRDLYANDQIAKQDFNKLYNQAQKQATGRSYSSEIRGYVKRQLQPESDAPKSHAARQLDAMFAFDDWLEKNPNAKREEVRKEADTIISDFRKIRYASGVTELPAPRFITKPRDKIQEADLDGVKERLAQELRNGTLSEREAASQAALLRRWYEIVKERE